MNFARENGTRDQVVADAANGLICNRVDPDEVAAKEDIGAKSGVKPVIARAALQRIIPGGAVNLVTGAATGKPFALRRPLDGIGGFG